MFQCYVMLISELIGLNKKWNFSLWKNYLIGWESMTIGWKGHTLTTWFQEMEWMNFVLSECCYIFIEISWEQIFQILGIQILLKGNSYFGNIRTNLSIIH